MRDIDRRKVLRFSARVAPADPRTRWQSQYGLRRKSPDLGHDQARHVGGGQKVRP
jgi:hypothetical protein